MTVVSTVSRAKSPRKTVALNIGAAVVFFVLCVLLAKAIESVMDALLGWGWVWPALVFALAVGLTWSPASSLIWKAYFRNAVRNAEGKILPLPAIAILGGSALVWVCIFAGLSYALMRLGAVQYQTPEKQEVARFLLTDAYLWHFLDLMPGLKITDAFNWQAPVDLHSGWRGLLLLLFRAAVIYEVFAKGNQILKKDEPAKG